MRKNHHGKKDRLVKRVFALCLALAVICTCLVPVFATEGLIDPQVNQEASRPVDDGEASYPDDEVAGFGGDEAAGFGEPREVYDEGEAAGFGGDEVATRPVEGGEDNLDGGPSVKDSEWGTVIDYGTSTDPSSSTETQWSGEDDVVEKPDDKVVVSGDEIKKLQDMVVYRFWLKELNTLDLQDITAQAQINNMTESEYLARNGEVLWNLYFIQAVPRTETIADYSSYIENPSSNRDPKGELRRFDYWYTLDEFGNRVRLNLTDPTSNILDDKTTTVNVYAAWKDGTVGSDEEEDVDHEDLVDKNPVPVDLTAKASASYEDEDGNPKTTTLPVEVKNLPSAAHSLSVIHMGDDDMQTFYESHEDSFGEMMPILGLKISPKNAKGETVQPAKGDVATVTVSGLDKLSAMEGATADTLKVLHETSDGNVEILDVLSYQNGTLTFETSSFSPFVVVRTDGYAVDTLDINSITNVSIKDDIANSGHYVLKITVDGENYEGADAGKLLEENGYKVTWKQNGTTVKRTEVTNGVYTVETNGGWVDVIYTDGANKNYVVTVSKGTNSKSSTGVTVAYNKRLENGDFENGGSNQTAEGTPGLVWKTTAWDHVVELANVGSNTYEEYQSDGNGNNWNYQTTNFGGWAFGASSTPNGSKQFAELNATQEGALYQDVLTKPGLTMSWQFSHKARTRMNYGYSTDWWGHVTKKSQNDNVMMPTSDRNEDKVAMVIAPLELVENITTQAQLEALLNKCGSTNGTYHVDGDGTNGKIGKSYPVYIAYDSSKITTYRSRSGWNYSTSPWNTQSGTYEVPEGQYLTRFFFVAISTAFDSGALRVGNLLDNVWFAQETPPAPTEGTGRITVTKKFYGLTLDEAKKVAEKGIISGDTGSISFNGDAWTPGTDARGSYIAVSHVINNLSLAANTEYQYTFTEDTSKAAADGYTLTKTLVNDEENVSSGSVNIRKENNDQYITFSNIYEKNTADVTLTKHVTGLMGDTHKEFAFSITGLDDRNAMLENGDLSDFTLMHSGSVTLKNVPMDTVFAVVETLGVDSGYETKATGYDTAVTDADRTFYYKLVLKDGQQVLMACDANGNNEKEQNELAITVTNHCTLKPDTGVLLDTLPYIVILAVVAGGVALLMLRKRRKEDD